MQSNEVAPESDHRLVAHQLDLFHFQDEAPGMAFWHPNGFQVYRVLEDAVREVTASQGYCEVRTPQILRRAAWEASGHWNHFQGGMFHVNDQAVQAAVKPVSCPGHLYIAGRRAPSYRELPLRYAELGVVHRDEPSGTLHGLLRLRQFTQDDGHIFCADEEQATDEVVKFCEALPGFYRAFGFHELSVTLSTRPEDRAGDDALWDRAEDTLHAALRRIGHPYEVQPGAGAFYGPKIEYALRDRMGRQWQCGTIQLDLVMPRSFDLKYVEASGQRKHVVMLHRALYGSLERFLGIVLEQHGLALPPWLAPLQVAVCPISEAQVSTAADVCRQLRDLGVRAATEAEGSLSKRLALAHAQGVPIQLLLGSRELQEGSVTLRRGKEQQSLQTDVALREVAAWCARPAFVQ